MAEHVEASDGSQHKRIVLISVDDSIYSQHALDFYCGSFRKENDLIHLVHVQEIPSLPVEYYGFSYAEDMQALHDAATKKGDEVVEKYKRMCDKRKLPNVIISKPVGHPGQEIIQKANDINASVIIIGTRGQGLLSRTLLGSVSDFVVHHSLIPVCVVHLDDEEKKGN